MAKGEYIGLSRGKGQGGKSLIKAVNKVAARHFGWKYSTGNIQGKSGNMHRTSYHTGVPGQSHDRYGRADQKTLSTSDKEHLTKKADLFKAGLAKRGIDPKHVDVQHHVGSGLYASVRVNRNAPKSKLKLHTSGAITIKEAKEILEGKSEASYHSVFSKNRDGSWSHEQDHDNHSDARETMRSLNYGGYKTLKLIVPHKDAQWHKGAKYINDYVKSRQGEKLQEARKAGPIANHVWLGKQAKSVADDSVGTVQRVTREHTFSRMVPFITTVTLKHANGSTSTHRQKHIRVANPLKNPKGASGNNAD